MQHLYLLTSLLLVFFSWGIKEPRKVFDVHIHGSTDVNKQLEDLQKAGVYRAALSSSWSSQNSFRGKGELELLYGLMFPCPNGKVPYSLQECYTDSQDWPSIKWVETQIRAGKIDFFGEVLSQYYGITPSDSLLMPYYALADKYNLPVGIHTGGAGPGHGSPNFKMELGDPLLLEKIISRFPNLRLWVMHSGDQFYKQTITLMQRHPNVYADISVLSNPAIVPPDRFELIMKAFLDADLENRLMFGSDNGDIIKTVHAIESLSILSERQKNNVFYKNAERFFK